MPRHFSPPHYHLTIAGFLPRRRDDNIMRENIERLFSTQFRISAVADTAISLSRPPTRSSGHLFCTHKMLTDIDAYFALLQYLDGLVTRVAVSFFATLITFHGRLVLARARPPLTVPPHRHGHATRLLHRSIASFDARITTGIAVSLE